MINLFQTTIFDSHLHIINPQFPLIANHNYIPPPFTVDDYLSRMQGYNLCGGAVVSGSFQAFDQNYLCAALQLLGPNFVGVTQLPVSVGAAEILRLDELGVRGVRFNLKRGGAEDVRHLASMAARVYEIARWHVELYVDAHDLAALAPILVKLPSVSIDHLGLSKAGFSTLIQLAQSGVRVKATGFGRVDFSVAQALTDLFNANPNCLMFGTDLPSTRAPRAYADSDLLLIFDTLGEAAARSVLSENARSFYRLT